MTWYDSAAAIIAKVHADLPPDADLKAREKALRAVAWQAHQGTSWGKKTWARARRDYLEKHGLPKRAAKMPLSPLERLMEKNRP